MTEKVGLIKNPLTIIAIFAGIAEVSGTIVLPFVAPQNQELFIWFLIIFPTILVVSFFVTLNFNNKVLYAPSDYKDEGNYLLSNKYNTVTQTSVLVKEPLNEAFESLKVTVNDTLSQILYTTENFANTQVVQKKPADLAQEPLDDKGIVDCQVVSNMPHIAAFINKMSSLGYRIDLYDNLDKENAYTANQAIWLGENVSLKAAKEVILNAKESFDFIQYVKISQRRTSRDESRRIFIGGSTESAMRNFKLMPIDIEGFEKIKKASTIVELHQIINTYKK